MDLIFCDSVSPFVQEETLCLSVNTAELAVEGTGKVLLNSGAAEFQAWHLLQRRHPG